MHFYWSGLIWHSHYTFENLLFWSWRLFLIKLWWVAMWARGTFSLSVVPWDFLLCRSQGALLRKHQDRGGIGAGLQEFLINSLCMKPLPARGKVVFPPGHHPPSCHHPAVFSNPSHTQLWWRLKIYDGSDFRREWSLCKNLVFKRRVTHSKLSLSFIPFISVASPVNLFSSLLPFPWERPLPSTWRGIHHPFYLPKP